MLQIQNYYRLLAEKFEWGPAACKAACRDLSECVDKDLAFCVIERHKFPVHIYFGVG